jgi:YidC/Oxa1 family membrane protein insertase
MFPMSRKQTLNAQKMQLLQPEIKKLQEKYKKDPQGLRTAQQELFKKHNYNPLSGCLVMFVQLPIFIGLYRALMVDVELRQAPLISESIRWCSNLAAPDMLYNWSRFMPDWVTSGVGIFGLGPYFNLLPMLTVVLFLWQQRAMMPPAVDEQSAMQQKVMQYMMIFMGVLFFKVASGLCLYFIASSLWGMAERKLLPKPTSANGNAKIESRAEAKARAKVAAQAAAERNASGDGAARNKSKNRGAKG